MWDSGAGIDASAFRNVFDRFCVLVEARSGHMNAAALEKLIADLLDRHGGRCALTAIPYGSWSIVPFCRPLPGDGTSVRRHSKWRRPGRRFATHLWAFILGQCVKSHHHPVSPNAVASIVADSCA